MYKFTKKDIIRINQEIGESGQFSNESSLDYALQTAKSRKSWLYELSHIVRSILVDHVFTDGNKRTALALMLTYFDYHGVECDKQRMVEIVHKVAKKNLTNVMRIMKEVKNGIY